jgi:hypothetical protein
MNRTKFAAATLAVIAGVVMLAQPASAGTQLGKSPYPGLKSGTKLSTAAAGIVWAKRSDAAIEAAIAADNGAETAFGYSWLASAIAHQSPQGWDDPRAMTYLNEALAQRLPSGGFGLNYAWDAFGDHTVNPATTTYTITLYQVGEVELEAYQAGKVPYSDIVSILRAVYATPRIPVKVGIGLAYSDNPNDVKPGYVVHNIDQAIAMFLQDTLNAGIPWSQAQAKRWIGWLQEQEVASYRPATFDWPYRSGSPAANDPAHNAIGIADLMTNNHALGRPGLTYMMQNPLGSSGVVAHIQLGAWDCVDAASWTPQYDAAVQTPTFSTFGYYAQFGRWGSLTGAACAAPRDLPPSRSHS